MVQGESVTMMSSICWSKQVQMDLHCMPSAFDLKASDASATRRQKDLNLVNRYNWDNPQKHLYSCAVTSAHTAEQYLQYWCRNACHICQIHQLHNDRYGCKPDIVTAVSVHLYIAEYFTTDKQMTHNTPVKSLMYLQFYQMSICGQPQDPWRYTDVHLYVYRWKGVIVL